MQVKPDSAAGMETYQGQTYYFCSQGCAAKFRADPAKYLAPQTIQAASTGRQQVYLPDGSADHPR